MRLMSFSRLLPLLRLNVSGTPIDYTVPPYLRTHPRDVTHPTLLQLCYSLRDVLIAAPIYLFVLDLTSKAFTQEAWWDVMLSSCAWMPSPETDTFFSPMRSLFTFNSASATASATPGRLIFRPHSRYSNSCQLWLSSNCYSRYSNLSPYFTWFSFWILGQTFMPDQLASYSQIWPSCLSLRFSYFFFLITTKDACVFGSKAKKKKKDQPRINLYKCMTDRFFLIFLLFPPFSFGSHCCRT